MQFLVDNPLLVVGCLGLCWPAPVPIILAFVLARRYDLRNPLVAKVDMEV